MLNMKIDETRGRLEFEEQKLKNNMVNENVKQAKVHDYLHSGIDFLHVSGDTIQQRSMALDRRIAEIEVMIGVRACVDESTGKMTY